MNGIVERLRSFATWDQEQVNERRRLLVRSCLRWWGRVVVVSVAGFAALLLIERGAPTALAALPALAVGLLAVMGQPTGSRLKATLWTLATTIAVGALATFMGKAVVLVALVALLFGMWVVALLALVLVWGHWALAALINRTREVTDLVREQTQQAVSREQGSTK